MAVFGASIQDACKESGHLPRVVAETIAWLDAHVGVKTTEGLFAVRGDPARIQECKARYDRGEVMPLKGCSDAHTVGGVLKLYLSALPEPLLSYRLYDSLLAVAAVPAQSRRILALGSLLEHLDAPSKTTLAAMLAFLQRCATATAASSIASGAGGGGGGLDDGMGLDAAGAQDAAVRTLASLFSPLLLRLRGAGEDGAGGGHLAEDVARADHVLELLIEHHTNILLGGSGRAAAMQASTKSSGGGGLSQSSNGMNVSAGGGGETMTGATRAMRGLDLHGDKENAYAAAADKASAKTEQQQQVITAHDHQHRHQQATAVHLEAAATTTAAVDLFEGIDALMGGCVGSLMGGDDLFTAEYDRVAGTGLDVLYRTPVHRLPPEELAVEKQAIKRRLRSFDNHVAACSGRKATKEDKRHLRPLYLRLAHVKRQIHVLETTGAGMGQMPGYHSSGAQGVSSGGTAGHDRQRNRSMGGVR